MDFRYEMGLNWACFERYIVWDMSVVLWHRFYNNNNNWRLQSIKIKLKLVRFANNYLLNLIKRNFLFEKYRELKNFSKLLRNKFKANDTLLSFFFFLHKIIF